jgi:uncharacterized protein YigE (DUF2233 family)
MMLAASVLVGVTLALQWQPVREGVWRREVPMAEDGALAPVRVVAIRIDPSLTRFRLDSATTDYGTRGAWTVDRLTRDALVAVNTGQFIGGVPWGWFVHEGAEVSAPGRGSLAMSFVVDSAGVASLLLPAEVAAARGRVRLAFQSYPMLLSGDGTMPWELNATGRGVDLDHRDSRLALGLLADGSVVLALTRFTGLAAVQALPWGPTVIEMASFMKSLGCVRAVLLDGGISSQMALRGADGKVERWDNWRKVPLGLLVLPRADASPSPRQGGKP